MQIVLHSIQSGHFNVKENPTAVHTPSGRQMFAEQMELTLRKNDYKGGWHDMDFDELSQRLQEEVEETGNHPMPDTRTSNNYVSSGVLTIEKLIKTFDLLVKEKQPQRN